MKMARPSKRQRQNKAKGAGNGPDERKDGNNDMTYKKLRERWLKTTIANRMLAGSSILLTIATAGLVVVGFFQWRTSRNQLATMQQMIGQNERLIKASSDQANASAKSANVMDTEKQAVLDSADAAKKVRERRASPHRAKQGTD